MSRAHSSTPSVLSFSPTRAQAQEAVERGEVARLGLLGRRRILGEELGAELLQQAHGELAAVERRRHAHRHLLRHRVAHAVEDVEAVGVADARKALRGAVLLVAVVAKGGAHGVVALAQPVVRELVHRVAQRAAKAAEPQPRPRLAHVPPAVLVVAVGLAPRKVGEQQVVAAGGGVHRVGDALAIVRKVVELDALLLLPLLGTRAPVRPLLVEELAEGRLGRERARIQVAVGVLETEHVGERRRHPVNKHIHLLRPRAEQLAEPRHRRGPAAVEPRGRGARHGILVAGIVHDRTCRRRRGRRAALDT